MKAGVLVAAMVGTGILGGVVGSLLAGGPSSPAPAATPEAGPAPRDENLAKEVADLRALLEEMQASSATAHQDSARLRADLDRERKASADARARIESLEGGGHHGARPLLPGQVETGAIPLRLGRLGRDVGALSGKVGKTLELLQKPEAERWTAIREALGLSPAQEEDLKTAIKERDLALRDAMKVESREVTAPDGTTSTAMSVSTPDPEKMRENRRKYDEKVDATLTPEQAKRWREEGYETAAGAGSSTTVVTAVEGSWSEGGK
jgi:hypothetical protein